MEKVEVVVHELHDGVDHAAVPAELHPAKGMKRRAAQGITGSRQTPRQARGEEMRRVRVRVRAAVPEEWRAHVGGALSVAVGC